MDWTLAITRNREALLRLVAALFALAGLTLPPGAPPVACHLRAGQKLGEAVRRTGEGESTMLPHRIYRAILLVLRPAESAVRRLIIIAAYGLTLAPRTSRPFPGNIPAGTGQPRLPAFQLIDPLKRFSPAVTLVENSEYNDFWTDDEDAEEADICEDTGGKNTLPRISLPGYFDPVFAPPAEPLDQAFINAAHLGRRLATLKRALENLPREAKRLARWQAKRSLVLANQSAAKPIRLSAFRHGRPPGFRLKVTHEVDAILRECHGLMLDRFAEVDTS